MALVPDLLQQQFYLWCTVVLWQGTMGQLATYSPKSSVNVQIPFMFQHSCRRKLHYRA